ncbi:MAG: hypothetical protein E7347_04030 [Clostridiales bacterium]|nr:hypothetical protein [Clostridiales bacterium]
MNENKNTQKPINKLSLKPFYLRDLAVYICTAIIVLLLFVFFVFPKNNQPAKQGFIVSVNGKTAVTVNFNLTTPISVANDFNQLVKVENVDNGFMVTIYTSTSKDGFNEIYFNTVEKTAKVTESNCSPRKDCVHTPSINTVSGTIICAPRTLKISPVGFNGDGTIVVG